MVGANMRGSRGGDRGPDPSPSLQNHKSIGFLNNTGPDLLENHIATKKWRFAGGPIKQTPSDKTFWIRVCAMFYKRHYSLFVLPNTFEITQWHRLDNSYLQSSKYRFKSKYIM